MSARPVSILCMVLPTQDPPPIFGCIGYICSDPLRALRSSLADPFCQLCSWLDACGLICVLCSQVAACRKASMGSKQQAWAILCCSLVAVLLVTTTTSCKGAGGLDEQEASLFVDSSKSRQIPQTLFGIFFEVTLHLLLLHSLISLPSNDCIHKTTDDDDDPVCTNHPC